MLRFRDMEDGIFAGIWDKPDRGFTWMPGLNVFSGPSETPPDGPWLMAPGFTSWKPYSLVRRDRVLHREFGRVADFPSHERIKAFADQYGLLGQPFLWLGSGIREDGGFTRVSVAESIQDWRKVLGEFWLVLRTWDAVRVLSRASANSPETAHAQAWLQSRFAWRPPKLKSGRYRRRHSGTVIFRLFQAHPEPLNAVITPDIDPCRNCGLTWSPHDCTATRELIVSSPKEDPVALKQFTEGDLVGPARYWVHKWVNDLLHCRIHLNVLPFLDSRIRYMPESLFAAIYLKFALELAGATGRTQRCAHCGMPFHQTRSDQRYCPGPLGGPSACGNAAKQKRARQRKKSTGAAHPALIEGAGQ